MGTPDTDAVPIDPSQLQPGLFIWLDIKWMDHPFLTNRFMVRKDADVAVLQSLGAVGHLYYLPSKSEVEPLPLGGVPPATDASEEDARIQQAIEAERQALALARREKIRQVKDAAARADRAWENAASTTRQALGALAQSPRMAGQTPDPTVQRNRGCHFAAAQKRCCTCWATRTTRGRSFMH
jgi:hypothetical protein